MQLKLLTMDVRYEHDVVLARQRARAIASALKFDVQAQTRIATAVSEIVRNAYQYGGGGSIDFEIDNDAEKMFLITVRDQGRGISNLDESYHCRRSFHLRSPRFQRDHSEEHWPARRHAGHSFSAHLRSRINGRRHTSLP
jgi:anti-sigma regulatory factor (Ser/Thr protein kinase)